MQWAPVPRAAWEQLEPPRLQASGRPLPTVGRPEPVASVVWALQQREAQSEAWELREAEPVLRKEA
ncbi:MAG: hypothetical protein Fur0032_19110 [Terrimicrobiaceae bacterium]